MDLRLQKIVAYNQAAAVAFGNKAKVLASLPHLKPLEREETPKFVVSLTSRGRRLFDTAPCAIITLLNQRTKPGRVILWVAEEDRGNVPDIMEDLVEKGLDIRYCENVNSYAKLLPALREFPQAVIVTADDGTYYPQDWFGQLAAAHAKNPGKIVCHRARGIRVKHNAEFGMRNAELKSNSKSNSESNSGSNTKSVLPYSRWDVDVDTNKYFARIDVPGRGVIQRRQVESIFPVGDGGILYPPGSLHKDVSNAEMFTSLAPYCDDVYFWAMARINREYFDGRDPYVVIPGGCEGKFAYVEPRRPDEESGASANVDKAVEAVIGRFPEIKETIEKIEEECYAVLTPCNFVMKLDLSEYVHRFIYNDGCFEKGYVLKLLSYLPEGGVFFDIGANVGVYSLNFSKKAKMVYSFEATETTYRHLLETIEMNGVKNISLNLNAVHSESGLDINIYAGADYLGGETNGNNGMFGGLNTTETEDRLCNTVKSIAIDDFVRDNGVERLDVIKIDIEGNELSAFKGMRESIRRFRPVIFSEMNPHMTKKAGYGVEALYDFFAGDLGYSPFMLGAKDNELVPAENVDIKWRLANEHDIFFIPA